MNWLIGIFAKKYGRDYAEQRVPTIVNGIVSAIGTALASYGVAVSDDSLNGLGQIIGGILIAAIGYIWAKFFDEKATPIVKPPIIVKK